MDVAEQEGLINDMALTQKRTNSRKPGSDETGDQVTKPRPTTAPYRNTKNSNPVYMTISLLAAMGVNRGVRFLDSFGKVMFGGTYTRQPR